MKVIIESDDPMEIKRLIKSKDMALCLWDIIHNSWREFKHTDYDYKLYLEKIGDLMDEHDINIDELID